MELDLHKLLNWGGFGLVITGVLIASESLPLPLPNPLALGATVLGVGLALAFADALFTGEITFSRRGFTPELYQGLAARLWGALMVLIGAAFTAGGLIEFFSPGALAGWFGTPSGQASLLILVGLAVGMYGLRHVLGPAGEGRAGWRVLGALPFMGVYAVIALAGLGLAAAGLVQLILPEVASAALEALRQAIPAVPTPPLP